MTVGEKICKCRKALGMSQGELGEMLHVSRQTVSLWEKNQTVPTIDNLIRLKEIFNISIDELLSGEEKNKPQKNTSSLDSICAALAYAMGITPPKYAAEKNWDLANYIDKVFFGKKADRVIMYNPDGIGQWIYEKYPDYLEDNRANTGIEIHLASVIPPVTPVCFGTMYAGAQPEVHGICEYQKPVIKIDTLFDSLLRAGKKIALITYQKCSLSRIFLDRNIDYYHYEDGSIEDVNAKAMEVILRDEHDFIVIYNGNYDAMMHKYGPENPRTLAELRVNAHVFSCISNMIKNNWKHHNTLLGFAMDHGCHEIDGGCGSHGLDMVEDMNIVHFYKGFYRDGTPGNEDWF